MKLANLYPGRRGLARVRSIVPNRDGTAVIDFGLAFPAFIFFVIGLIEFSRILWTNSALQLAVDQTSRYVVANPTATITQIQDYAAGQMINVDISTVGIDVAYETAGGVNFVVVTATTPLSSATRLVPIPTFTLRGRSRVPLTG